MEIGQEWLDNCSERYFLTYQKQIINSLNITKILQEVDMIVASLSVTAARDTVIDFIEYYFEYGAAIMKKPDEDENKWRVIAQPFRWPVWVCIMVSVPLAGLIAWIITLIVSKTVNSDTKHDCFTDLAKSTWYTFGAVLTQGM